MLENEKAIVINIFLNIMNNIYLDCKEYLSSIIMHLFR